MEEKTSINYIMSNEKIRNLVFEEWEKFSILISQGPDTLKEYFCNLWNETKIEFEYLDDIDVTDLDKEIKPEDFNVSYSVLNNGIKVLNFIMPKPITCYGQVVYLSLAITKKIPRLFTLKLSKNKSGNNCFSIDEWLIDFENNNYRQINYKTIDEPVITNFLDKINDILNLK